jgi:hypothetical protein
MFKRNFRLLCLFTALILTPVYADETLLELSLQTVDKEAPSFERAEENALGKDYSLKMVKISNCPQIKVPPHTDATVLYYGVITLGSPVQSHGILVDFEGKNKVFWVDSDADGDFSQEKIYQIFKSDRYPGLNVYYSPEPVMFQVAFSLAGEDFKIPLQYNMPFLLISRVGHGDKFFLNARTWLTGSVEASGEEIRVALVDTNDNGNYNDPDDLLFVDQNYDLNFSAKEARKLKDIKTIQLKSKARYQLDLQFLPQKIILTGKS